MIFGFLANHIKNVIKSCLESVFGLVQAGYAGRKNLIIFNAKIIEQIESFIYTRLSN